MSKIALSHILFIDIETAPLYYNYSDLPDTAKEVWIKKWQYLKEISPEEHYQKAGIYAEFSKIICIGVGYVLENKMRLKTFINENETELLNSFAQLINTHFTGHQHVLCAHNGKEFDFPFICRRFLINKLKLPNLLNIQGKKSWEIPHIDTMDMWRFGDYKNYTSLQLLAHAFNIPSPKDDIDGSQVSKVYHQEKNLKRIADYCLKDVETLIQVYLHLTSQEPIKAEYIELIM